MIIYFCLFIPLLFFSADSSSIRGRNHKNDLVPFMSSRFDAMKRDPNSLKVVSKDPFIIQLHMPNSKEMDARGAKEKDKKRKRPMKKRVSKIKPLRKKHRKRRDLLTSKTRPRDEKLFRFENPRPANVTERQLKNNTRNSVNRMEILKALSYYPQKTETKRNKLEGIRNLKNEGKINIGKAKKNNISNRNLPKHHLSLSDRSKLVYPNTPKLDFRPQKYTHKDLIADRERLEQKIKYIKNMLNGNVTTTDDGARVRRRSDTDRTANKIAKMFLTLSAVNGLHDKKKSKCNDDDDDDDDYRVDVWQKDRRNNPLRKSTSSNEERYKVKKWIEFMKNKRSSGKTCPCMANAYGDESEAFPLEQKLPKGYFLMERGRSSEESSESYTDPLYYSKDKINKNDNVKKRLSKSQDQDNKNKALSTNGKRRLEVPMEDLELYRSRARQILRNAEEILDKIKEEEEKRLAMPNILMSQLKELTARIHGDPRNDENELIRKIQKNLGWGPLATPQQETDGTFLDNVKSFILDPYEKAKALTDESTKKLSSYLLRNLGKLQDTSEEQDMRNAADKSDDETLKIYLGEVPNKEENPTTASLAKKHPVFDLSRNKEDLQNWKDTLSAISGGGDDAVNKENNWNMDKEESSLQKVEDIVKEVQEKLNDFKDENTKETSDSADNKKSSNFPEFSKEIVAESNPERLLERVALKEKEKDDNEQETAEFQSKNEKEIKSEEESGAMLEKTAKGSDIIERQPFRGTEKTYQGKEGESNVQASRDMPEEEEKVAMKLKVKEKDDNEQETAEFQSKNEKEIKSEEESGAMLEKTAKGSDIIERQPFRETEGMYQGKEGESNVQASRGMQEEEEKVAKSLKESGKDSDTVENQPFRGTEETHQGKEGKSYVQASRDMQEEEEKVAKSLNESEKDSDTVKKQPFRGTEETDEGKEGESNVQASRDMPEEEEKVAMKLKVEEKYDNDQETAEFQSKNEKGNKSEEESGAMLEKTAKGSDIIQRQPFRETEGMYKEKEGESNVEASRDMPEEEEKVAKSLNESGKDSDTIENQSFRGTEGTYQGKEGESYVQASRDMREEEKDFEGTVKMPTEEKNDNENLKTDPMSLNSNTEEKAANQDSVAQVLENQEENEKVAVTALPESEKAALRDETLTDYTSDESVGKKSDESFPSITLIGKAPSTDSESDPLLESKQKENVKADFADEFESNEEPILEKQKALDGGPSAEEIKVEESGSENFKASAEMQEEKESNIASGELLKESRKEDSSSEEIIQEEIGAKTLPEYADLVQESNVSEGISGEKDNLGNEQRKENTEILELRNDETTSTENVDGQTLKAMLHNQKNTPKEKLEEVSSERSTEDLNTPLRVTLDQKALNQPLDESTSQESDVDDLLKETKSGERKNEFVEESNVDENVEKSQEILAKENDDETSLSIEKPTDENQSNVENTDLRSFLKESNPGEAFENVKEGGETPLRATMTNKDEDTIQTEQNKSGGDFDRDGNEMNLKSSLDKDEYLEKDDDVSLKASLDRDEDLKGKDDVNLKASLDKNEDLEKNDNVNLKGSPDRDEDLRGKDDVNLKASLDKNEDLEKDDEVNLKASLDRDEDLEKNDEVNLKGSLDRDEDLEKDDEVNLKASLDRDEDLEGKDDVNLKGSSDRDEYLEKNDDVNLKASLDKDEDLEKDDEANLKSSLDKDENLEKDDEGNLKASLDRDEDSEKDDSIILKASNRYGYEDFENLSEGKDVVSQKESQENDNQRESNENVENILNTEKDEKSSEVGSPRENQKDDSGERDIEIVEKIRNTQETLDKENQKATTSRENQNVENINEKDDEAIVKAEKLDENVSVKDEETNEELLKSNSNEEIEDSLKESEVVKEGNPNEDVKDEKEEILEEILKEIPDNHRPESLQVDEDEQDLNKPREGEYLKNETQENLEERPDEEILQVEKVDDESQRSQEENVEATLEDQNKDMVLKEENIEASEDKEDDLEEGENVRAVFDNQEQYDEVAENFDEDVRGKNENMDVEKTLLKAKNFDEDPNLNDETLKAVLSEQDQENLEGNYENLQEENPEEGKDETPLRNASLEDEFDNKIDYDTALKSAQSLEETDDIESMKNFYESEETARAFPQDLSNQIDEENKETVLKSAHFDAKSPDENRYSYETVTDDNVEAKAPNPEDANFQENLQHGQMDFQKPDMRSKSLKASKLKVPKWIGKIMKDLNGKEKTDITAMQNLNPDKIDDMLGKIGKAEQQNQLESAEVDCVKECACAEEMNTRSRNIGRYEIVKDFLHWVKDLQLNRVLSDE